MVLNLNGTLVFIGQIFTIERGEWGIPNSESPNDPTKVTVKPAIVMCTAGGVQRPFLFDTEEKRDETFKRIEGIFNGSERNTVLMAPPGTRIPTPPMGQAIQRR